MAVFYRKITKNQKIYFQIIVEKVIMKLRPWESNEYKINYSYILDCICITFFKLIILSEIIMPLEGNLLRKLLSLITNTIDLKNYFLITPSLIW